MKRLTPVTLRKRAKFVAPKAKPAYECRRCGSHEYQTGELRGAGGLISSVPATLRDQKTLSESLDS
jgi:hypothetical protein